MQQQKINIVPSLITHEGEGITPELARILRYNVASERDAVGVVDWNMGNNFLGDDYAGDDYAGDDYAGDDYAGEGDAAGVDFLGAVYSAMRRGQGRRGAPPRGRAMPARGALPGRRLGAPLTQPPAWREPQAAPGVMQPYEGLVRLPFAPSVANGVFPGGSTAWSFTGLPQKPWRGERLVAIVTRSAGAAAVVPLLQFSNVGIDPQQAGNGFSPLEAYGPGSFGVRECWAPSQPGISITISGIFSIPVPVGEFVTIALDVRGRIIA